MQPSLVLSRALALSTLALLTASFTVRTASADTRNADGLTAPGPARKAFAAGHTSAVTPGSCAPLDLVFVIDDTGSMGPAIDSVKDGLATIIDTAVQAAGGDLRLGLLTFKDSVTAHHALTDDIEAVRSTIQALGAGGGSSSSEASDEAKNTVVNNLPAGVRNDSAGHSGTQIGDFTVPYREDAEKVVVLITDAPPGGFDDATEPPDATAMHVHAETALSKGIVIADVFVPTGGDYGGQLALLQDDATTSGGAFSTVAPDGSGTAEAINLIVEQCGRAPAERRESSTTQPAAELVMPFDSTDGKATFLLVSNIDGTSPDAPQISTHWVFWSDDCDELANISICLTLNDTVAVDPRAIRAIGPRNQERGPLVNLDGKRGLVTVTAYETDESCADFRATGEVLRDDAIVGAYTIADQNVGYAFGRDAEGFGTDNPAFPRRVVLPGLDEGDRFALQLFDPTTTDASVAVLAHLRGFETGPAEPVKGPLTFSTTFTDNLEISVSLPNLSLSCVQFYPVVGGLIPETVTAESSGMFSLRAVSGVEENDALFAIIGQAVGPFGAVAGVKEMPE